MAAEKKMSTIRYYITDDKALILANVDHDFYRMNATKAAWVKDQNAARHVYTDAPDADPATKEEVKELAEKWFPGKGAGLIPG